MNKLLISPLEIAKITNGTWENFNNDFIINEFHYIFRYLTKNDLFILVSKNWSNAYKSNEHKIQRAIQKGISSIIAEEDIDIKTSLPILRVKNSYVAIQEIAKFVSQKTTAKKVLVTGSYGKTGFKIHLNHIVQNQLNTYTRKNSANYSGSTYCNLASIKKENELFIMEIPVASYNKLKTRTEEISPYISVLTSIGHEGIERYKTVDAIIKNKLTIASGLQKGGKLLLPFDDRYYDKILKEANTYKDIKILTFGSNRKCNAHILYKKFSNFGWDIIAKIEDTVVAYRIPFFEEYAINSSLAELLTAYHLGVDIHNCADEYYSCTNYKSSGIFYKVYYKNKNFFLYDQTSRGGIEGYESFFKTFSYIKPDYNGKKILVTSEFVDYIDGEMDNIDIQYFQKIIEKSEFKTIFSVEKFSEHINVLKDKNIWKNHSIDYKNIQNQFLDTIENNDIVAIKSIFESNLENLIKDIKQLNGIKLENIKQINSMKNQNNAFRDLRCLNISDLDNYKKHIAIEKKNAWVHYFPFLYFWSLSASRELLIGEESGIIKLFLLNKLNRKFKPSFELYIPPAPFDIKVLNNCFETIYRYKGKQKAKILWLDKEDLLKIKKHKQFQHIKINFKELEYIYNPKIYNNLSGSKFRNIRQQIGHITKLDNVEILPYDKKYLEQSLELLNKWEKNKRGNDTFFEDSTYSRNALKYAHLFDKNDLFGIVILINGVVKSFGFAGEIIKSYGSTFIGKSDIDIKGLQVFMKYHILLKLQYNDFSNDSSGLGQNGMNDSKRIFRPVKMKKIYSAYIDNNKMKINILDNKYKIKLISPSHLNEVYQLQLALFTKSDKLFSKENFSNYIKRELLYGVFVKNENYKLIAFILFKYRKEYLKIDAIGIDKNSQNQGIGRELLNFSIIKAKQYNKTKIMLEVKETNTNASNFYKNFGFKKQKTIKNFYPDDKNAFRMQYDIK